MPRFSCVSLSAACALALFSAAALAQTPPAPVVPTPVPAPQTAASETQIRALLDQTVTAQNAVSSLSATLDIQSVGGMGDANQTVTLALQKGLGAKAIFTDKTGLVAQVISNGKTLTIYDVHAKQYTTSLMPAGQTAMSAVFRLARALLPMMMSQPEGLRDNFIGNGIQSTLGTDTVGATPVDVITLHLPAKPNQPIVIVALAVGHDDHLLRKLTETITLSQEGKAKTMVHTETVTALTLTPTLTASDFTFTPPAGVKKGAAEAADPPEYDPRLKPGARPFAIAAKDLAGKPLTLSQYRGKVVLMDFWATWCGPCVGEMPNVIAAYKKYHTRGFDVVGISLDQDKSSLTSFIAQNKMPWRQVFDGKGWGSAVPHQYGVQAIPFGLLLNRNGTIAAVSVRGDALPAAIKVALAKK